MVTQTLLVLHPTNQLTVAGSFPSQQSKNARRKMFIALWNVRILMDNKESIRPEKRTTLIAKKLSHYRIDIAALSKTRLAEEGSITEPKRGYTFFWKGERETDHMDPWSWLCYQNKTTCTTSLPPHLS